MLQIIYPQTSTQLKEEKCDHAYHLLLFVQNTKIDEWWKQTIQNFHSLTSCYKHEIGRRITFV